MRRSAEAKFSRAFTITEILVVVAIVLVLLSIVVIAVGSATRTAQRSNTVALMHSIKQGLVQFENEFGYLPPVLDQERNLRFRLPSGDNRINGPDPRSLSYADDIQGWYSITTLAEYLIGYGGEDEDGYEGLGIRHPGRDGYWGASNSQIPSDPIGTLEYRKQRLNGALGAASRQGRVYGPYLQLGDQRLLGAIDPDVDQDSESFKVYFPGDALPLGKTWDELPKVIADYWGEPIRYYRKPHPAGAIQRDYRRMAGQNDLVPPSLADVIALRPWTTRRSDMDARVVDDAGDRTATTDLAAAKFALFSSGPDRRYDQRFRVDEEEYNRDNIVEPGS